MAYFHDRWVRNRGGRKRRPMIKVLGETTEEILSVGRRWPEATTINLPPRGKNAWKSKSLPCVWIDADRRDILEILNSTQVDENYLRVISFILRKDWYQSKIGMTEEAEAFFDREIRGNVIRLLRAGSWVDEPETLGLKKLNSQLEKLDLGRRKDLKFSSQPLIGPIEKYDRDFKIDEQGKIVDRHPDDSIPDFEAMYRDGSRGLREDILRSRPWMREMLVTRYGEP